MKKNKKLVEMNKPMHNFSDVIEFYKKLAKSYIFDTKDRYEQDAIYVKNLFFFRIKNIPKDIVLNIIDYSYLKPKRTIQEQSILYPDNTTNTTNTKNTKNVSKRINFCYLYKYISPYKPTGCYDNIRIPETIDMLWGIELVIPLEKLPILPQPVIVDFCVNLLPLQKFKIPVNTFFPLFEGKFHFPIYRCYCQSFSLLFKENYRGNMQIIYYGFCVNKELQNINSQTIYPWKPGSKLIVGNGRATVTKNLSSVSIDDTHRSVEFVQ